MSVSNNSPHNHTLHKVYLRQADIYISSGNPCAVCTVLGSCISVTFYSPQLKIGAITHSILPYHPAGSLNKPYDAGRYADTSIKAVLSKFGALKINSKSLQIKVFGGSQIFSRFANSSNQDGYSVGRKNSEAALKTLQELGLKATLTRIGGEKGRKLIFYPHSGEVWVRKLNNSLLHSSGTLSPKEPNPA